jgi:hypothetical protein
MKVGRTAREAIHYCRAQGGFLQKTVTRNKSGNPEVSYALQPIGIRVTPKDAGEALASGWLAPRDPGLFGDDPALAQTWGYRARPAAGRATTPARKMEEAMSRFTVKVVAFQPARSNTLVGFADAVIPEIRLRLFDMTVHQSGDSRWVNMPSRPQLDRETGAVQRDGRGKIVYAPTLGFLDEKTRKAFSDRVIEALIEFDPHAFDETTAA